MCYAKSTGKGRCDCDTSEKRRLRYHNKAALENQSDVLKINIEGTSTPRPIPSSLTSSEVSVAAVQELAQEIQALKKKWRKFPVEGYARDSILIKAERLIMRAGGIVSKLIEGRTGVSPSEVARITNMTPRLERRKLIEQVAALKPLERALEKAQETGDYATISVARWRRDKQQSIIDAAKKSYEKFKISQLAINAAAIQGQAEAALLVLGEIREIGGKKIEALGLPDALEQIEAVSRYMPSEWVDRTKTLPKLIVGWSDSAISGRETLGFYQNRIGKGQEDLLNTNFLPQKLRLWEKSQRFALIGVKDLKKEHKYSSVEEQENYSRASSATWIHEMTHRMEYANGDFFTKMEETFLIRRTSVNGVREEPIGHGFGLIIYEDSFIRRYMGREYPYSPAWEVLTVGAESIFGAESGGLIGVGEYSADEDARRFVLGAWATL